jgi:hypothetical protein
MQKKPDRYWSALQDAERPMISVPKIDYPEKPDRYWSAPQATESPVISVLEIGYVRRSEPNFADSRTLKA